MNLSRSYDSVLLACQPGVETPGYWRASLWDAFGVPATAVQARVAGFPPSAKSNVTVEVGTDHSTRAFPIRHVLRGPTAVPANWRRMFPRLADPTKATSPEIPAVLSGKLARPFASD